MILKKIALRNFRNYSQQEFIFNDKFNFVFGLNGHGKTNILESVSFTTFGKSFLGAAEADCVTFGNKEFFIESEFENNLGNKDRIIVSYDMISKTKSIHKNKEKVSAFSSEIFGRFPIVFLSPQSLNITHGNPSERRKFFDIMISQSSRVYLDQLKELSRILKQKNALLKNFTVYRKYSNNEFKDLLNSYNENLISVASGIIFRRLNFLSGFEEYFEKNFAMLIEQDHNADISYLSEAIGEIYPADIKEKRMDPGYIRERTEMCIYGKRDEEIRRSVSLAGPHRDDYIFRLKKNDIPGSAAFELRSFASQGEHKTFLVALKLSEYDYLKEKKSTSPILLLDDVLSELDESRVTKIISHLKDYGQIFLTTTDSSYLGNLKEYYKCEEISVFEIKEGKLVN